MEIGATRAERSTIIRVAVVLIAFLFIGLTCVFFSMNEVQLQRLMIASRSAYAALINQNTTTTDFPLQPPAGPAAPAFRLLIGILTLPDSYERRSLLRLIYGTQTPKISHIDVKFVFCNLTKEDQKVLVALEIMRYDDIIILNCSENMNDGKTYTYFSSLPDIFDRRADGSPPYDYVMKDDDDTFFRINRLEESLKDKPKLDMYYGFVIPCSSMDPFNRYMSGMGYILSWDLAEFIKNSSYAKNHKVGAEDMKTAEWLAAGHVGNHRFNNKPEMYEFPQPERPAHGCAHDLIPDTIAVHMLKSNQRWVETLNYFNFTKKLEPSKLYHIHR